MFNKIKFVVLVVTAVVCVSAVALAAPAAKTYQVTGAVVELTDAKIVVDVAAGASKGEKWEIARNADTKVTGNLQVGNKVTIQYQMVATTVTVKAVEKAATAPKTTK